MIWWTSASFLGLGFFGFPKQLTGPAHDGAVLSFVLEGLSACAAALLILSVMRRYPGQTAVEVALATLGWFGRAFEFTMGGIITLTLAASYRLFATLLHETMLSLTPLPAIVALAALCTAYGAWVGVVPISRTLQILLPASIVVGIGVFSLTFVNLRSMYLIPHWTGLSAIAAGTYRGTIIIAGLQNLFIYSAFVPAWSVRREVLTGIAINFGMLLVVLAGTVGTLGTDAVSWVDWPGPFLATSVDLRGFYIERIGFFAMLSGIAWVVLFLIVTTFTSAVAVAQIVGLRPRQYRWLVPVLVVFPATLAVLIPSGADAFALARTVLPPLTLVMIFLKGALLLTATVLRGRRGAPV